MFLSICVCFMCVWGREEVGKKKGMIANEGKDSGRQRRARSIFSLTQLWSRSLPFCSPEASNQRPEKDFDNVFFLYLVPSIIFHSGAFQCAASVDCSRAPDAYSSVPHTRKP